MISKKVYFYKLNVETITNQSNSTFLTEKSVGNMFKTIYSKLKTIKNKNTKVYPIHYFDSMYIIEVVKYYNNKAILKIGKLNSADTVALRDIKTYQSTNVPMSKTQNLELFTYCMIDFKTCIISYISIGFSPRISILEEFINNNIDIKKYHAKISIILCDDVIKLICEKNLIGDITLSISVPSDEVLSEKFGLGINEFDSIFVNNVKGSNFTFRLSGVRNKSLFKSKKDIGNFIDSIRKKFGSNIRSFKFSAKNEDERKQEFDILSYKFCKTVDLYINKKDKLTEIVIINLLEQTYDDNLDELIKYTRVNYDKE